MKNSEILACAVADAAGLSIEITREVLSVIMVMLPAGHRLNEERPAAEAERLLAAFRKEREGIRQWLLSGYLDAVANGCPPFPLSRGSQRKKKGHNRKGKKKNRADCRPRPGGNRRR